MTRLPRYTRLSRGGPIKPKKRKPSEFARIFGSRERVRWIKAQPCLARRFGCVGPIENAHVQNGGMGRKADFTDIVPLCQMHHAELHLGGTATFERRYRLSLADHAAVTEIAWQAVVRSAA